MKSVHAFSEDSLAELRAYQVLRQAIANNRLAQSVLLHGEDIHALDAIGRLLAALILETRPEKLEHHPDLFYLRTRGKARQITIGSAAERKQGEWPPNTMRRFLHDLHLSPQTGHRKVGIVVEADRMNDSTANAFLKTLEEPPAGTTLFLLTTRPYDLLDTIRSRCLNFGLPTALEKIEEPAWRGWLNDYRSWLGDIVAQPSTRKEVARATLAVYGLILRFEMVLGEKTSETWKAFKAHLPEHLSEEELLALESGVSKSIRQQLFADLERETRNFALDSQSDQPHVSFFPLTRAVNKLERLAWLTDRVHLQEATALEAFFLESLRIWSRR